MFNVSHQSRITFDFSSSCTAWYYVFCCCCFCCCFLLLFFATSNRHNYGHTGDVQLVFGGERPNIYGQVARPAHRMLAGKPPPHKSFRPDLNSNCETENSKCSNIYMDLYWNYHLTAFYKQCYKKNQIRQSPLQVIQNTINFPQQRYYLHFFYYQNQIFRLENVCLRTFAYLHRVKCWENE